MKKKEYRFNEYDVCLNPDILSMPAYHPRQPNSIGLYIKDGRWMASYSFVGSTGGTYGVIKDGYDTKEAAVIACLKELSIFLSAKGFGDKSKTREFYDLVEATFLQKTLF